MFMTEDEYKETLDLLSKIKEPNMLLRELTLWAKEVLQVDVYNYLCDYTSNGLKRLRLVLWDYAIEQRMKDGPNFDESKQKAIADKFAELARANQLHQDYWDGNDVFVCYETICDEIKKDILKLVRNEITSIQHPDIWKIEVFFESIHIFYETDEQISCNSQNGVSENIESQCTQLVKKYDQYNAFNDGANCIFTSHQTLDEKYAGSTYYYYHG